MKNKVYIISPSALSYKCNHCEYLKHHYNLENRGVPVGVTQSLADPFMTMTIGITDATQIFERIGTKGLQGEEFIQLSLKTPTFEGEDIIEDLFYVTGYSPITTDAHNLQRGMVLHCVSKEKLINTFSKLTGGINKSRVQQWIRFT